uniref:Uncharacterized protein n=1 Tax=Oryza barthii TaxID=65489 RepID=A0A0D3HNI5_9ORYZ
MAERRVRQAHGARRAARLARARRAAGMAERWEATTGKAKQYASWSFPSPPTCWTAVDVHVHGVNFLVLLFRTHGRLSQGHNARRRSRWRMVTLKPSSALQKMRTMGSESPRGALALALT